MMRWGPCIVAVAAVACRATGASPPPVATTTARPDAGVVAIVATETDAAAPSTTVPWDKRTDLTPRVTVPESVRGDVALVFHDSANESHLFLTTLGPDGASPLRELTHGSSSNGN